MKAETAQVRAIQVLGWLAGHQDLWDVFLGATGASADEVRAGAENPEYLGSVLDFLMMDDQWVIEASAALGWSNEQIRQIRQQLPGGAEVSWT